MVGQTPVTPLAVGGNAPLGSPALDAGTSTGVWVQIPLWGHVFEEDAVGNWRRRHPRGAVKCVLLQLLQETGAAGLNARRAAAMAAARGMEIDRTTMSSLLSRLKADQVVT